MREWLYVLWLVAGEKRGMSAKSIQNALGVGSYKTAWFALHKDQAGDDEDESRLLSGIVEVDETYVGRVASDTRGRGTKKTKRRRTRLRR